MMKEREQRREGAVAVLLAPEGEQRRALEEGLPDWRVVGVPEEDVAGGESPAASADAVLVYARTHEEDHALEVTKRLRRDRRFDGIPLLVAITIYQMPLGHDVKTLPKADFVFRPIAPDDFAERLEALKACSVT